MFSGSAIDQWYAGTVQLHYNYRVYPDAGQREALARSFGCARVVFNDGLRARQRARENGQKPEAHGGAHAHRSELR